MVCYYDKQNTSAVICEQIFCNQLKYVLVMNLSEILLLIYNCIVCIVIFFYYLFNFRYFTECKTILLMMKAILYFAIWVMTLLQSFNMLWLYPLDIANITCEETPDIIIDCTGQGLPYVQAFPENSSHHAV